MLVVKRLITWFFLTLFLFAALGMAGLVAGSASAGANAARQQNATTAEEGKKAGELAGKKFWEDHGASVFQAAFGSSFVISTVLVFSGALPWCRRKAALPSAL